MALAATRLEAGGETAEIEDGLIAAVRSGLGGAGQKWLPSRYLYDAVGSLLFEAICALPSYGLAAADTRLVRACGPALGDHLGESLLVAELGSGSGGKTRLLLERLPGEIEYFPIEVSALALARCTAELAPLPGIGVHPLRAEYVDGLDRVMAIRRARYRDRRLLVLFLGSTLGNFNRREAGAFLADVRRRLSPGDALLLGLDLASDADALQAAYDDAGGVTAAFNLNLLVRLNRELGADFDLRLWRHEVRYRRRERRVEMHLRARRRLSVEISAAALRVAFAAGETIWTESSCKFRAGEIPALLRRAGFQPQRQWVDAVWPCAETLALAV